MQNYVTLTNSQLAELISENIHSERNRQIMTMKLIDGYTYEKIAEIVDMSPRYIRSLVRKLTDRLKIT
ncbi:MAG: sigma-70 family RNA polymerase sigma factor [Oscillospiraceae bacterium]|nr:sigma-70 family RNA polymerase sigma factor [Oscillospiraceae bacterium]